MFDHHMNNVELAREALKNEIVTGVITQEFPLDEMPAGKVIEVFQLNGYGNDHEILCRVRWNTGDVVDHHLDQVVPLKDVAAHHLTRYRDLMERVTQELTRTSF